MLIKLIKLSDNDSLAFLKNNCPIIGKTLANENIEIWMGNHRVMVFIKKEYEKIPLLLISDETN